MPCFVFVLFVCLFFVYILFLCFWFVLFCFVFHFVFLYLFLICLFSQYVLQIGTEIESDLEDVLLRSSQSPLSPASQTKYFCKSLQVLRQCYLTSVIDNYVNNRWSPAQKSGGIRVNPVSS